MSSDERRRFVAAIRDELFQPNYPPADKDALLADLGRADPELADLFHRVLDGDWEAFEKIEELTQPPSETAVDLAYIAAAENIYAEQDGSRDARHTARRFGLEVGDVFPSHISGTYRKSPRRLDVREMLEMECRRQGEALDVLAPLERGRPSVDESIRRRRLAKIVAATRDQGAHLTEIANALGMSKQRAFDLDRDGRAVEDPY